MTDCVSAARAATRSGLVAWKYRSAVSGRIQASNGCRGAGGTSAKPSREERIKEMESVSSLLWLSSACCHQRACSREAASVAVIKLMLTAERKTRDVTMEVSRPGCNFVWLFSNLNKLPIKFFISYFAASQFMYRLETSILNKDTRDFLSICQNNILRQILGIHKLCHMSKILRVYKYLTLRTYIFFLNYVFLTPLNKMRSHLAFFPAYYLQRHSKKKLCLRHLNMCLKEKGVSKKLCLVISA